MTLLEMIADAFDLDVVDVLNTEIPDTFENREYAGAVATLVTAVLDQKPPADLNEHLNERFAYQGGHHQPHREGPTKQSGAYAPGGDWQ